MLVKYLTREWNAQKGAIRNIPKQEYEVLSRLGKVERYVKPKKRSKKQSNVAVSEETPE